MTAPPIDIEPPDAPEMWDQMSLLERLSVLPEDLQEAYIEDLVRDHVDVTDPEFWLRPQQLSVVRSDKWVTLFAAGRGAGKTKTGSVWCIERAKTPETRFALLGRTVADVRDVMVEGESGIMASSPPNFQPTYTPSLRKLEWPNGSLAYTYSADQPDQLRGPQQHYGWADELAAFKLIPDTGGAHAWDHLSLSTRLGENPQILATTTPKRSPIIKELFRLATIEPEQFVLYQSSTLANRANLSPEYIRSIWQRYEGSSLERQELYGELIGDSPGALWRSADIVLAEVPENVPVDYVIGVDPGVSAGHGDATGIVVVAGTRESDVTKRRAWVVDDLTTQGPPEEWVRVIVEAWIKWSDPYSEAVVVVEGNQGGELLRLILRQKAPKIPIAIVKAVRSKQARAEPVVYAYRQRRVFHAREMPDLVDEQVGWEPDMRWSPNHLDAAVWGLSVLLVDPRPLYPFFPVSVGEGVAKARVDVIPAHRRERPTPVSGLRAAPWRPAARRLGPFSGARR